MVRLRRRQGRPVRREAEGGGTNRAENRHRTMLWNESGFWDPTTRDLRRVEDSSSSAVSKQKEQRVGQAVSDSVGFGAIPLGTERELIFVES